MAAQAAQGWLTRAPERPPQARAGLGRVRPKPVPMQPVLGPRRARQCRRWALCEAWFVAAASGSPSKPSLVMSVTTSSCARSAVPISGTRRAGRTLLKVRVRVRISVRKRVRVASSGGCGSDGAGVEGQARPHTQAGGRAAG
eukprot:scaffold90627_cov63-Phaeocystis_antarctica.AAC.3